MNAPEAPFVEPWQAQLFALTVALNEAGHFTWTEWTAVFGPRVQAVEASSYWQIWCEALVELLERCGFADAAEVQALTERWKAAARATPHGKPIVLSAAP
ncbi:nitrile hydratase accessory protein [Ostreiculturibacter nitratireducens]|uniref:nitrile hydratase accessory protein n=1 Tax=Ostreiculturibacter nitratireducens TaxID=3075226 RepID=UPI0031B613D3